MHRGKTPDRVTAEYSGWTDTRRLTGSGRVLHPALPGPGRVLRQNVAGSE